MTHEDDLSAEVRKQDEEAELQVAAQLAELGKDAEATHEDDLPAEVRKQDEEAELQVAAQLAELRKDEDVLSHAGARRSDTCSCRAHMPQTGRAIMLPVLRYRDLMMPAQSGEHEHHARRGAEVRFRDAAVDETGSAVKPQRVRIGGVTSHHAGRTGNPR